MINDTDQCHQRTIHHPHKTLFPYKTMRDQPGPYFMRHGMNQSTHSLSDGYGPIRPFPPPMSRRPPLPNHQHPWGLRPREKLGSGSSDHSLRTLSLSSTSGSYHCAHPHTSRLQPVERKPPIFYDYSEEFEDAVNPPPDFEIANPTPTRISKVFCPGMPDDDCDIRSESTDEEAERVVDYLRQVTMIEHAKEQDGLEKDCGLESNRSVSGSSEDKSTAQVFSHQLLGDILNLSLVSPQCSHMVASSNVSVLTLEDHQEALEEGSRHRLHQVTEPNNNGLESEASTVESPLDPETPILSLDTPLAETVSYQDEKHPSPYDHDCHNNNQGLGTLVGIPEPQTELTEPESPAVRQPDLTSSASASLPARYSCGRKDSRFFSLSSGLSDLASFVKCVDKHMQALEPENFEQYETPLGDSKPESSPNHERHGNQTVQETSAPPRTSSLAHYRVAHVGRKVNTPAPIEELERYQVISTRSGPTLVPQPISPAKMLRVKNSIPRLMKALPPLPGYSPASESPFNPTIVPVEFEPFEFSRLTDARSTLIEPFGSENHSKQTAEGCDPFPFNRGVCKPKLKLKNTASLASADHRRMRPIDFAQTDIFKPKTSEDKLSTSKGDYSTAPVKRRLPIRISRPALGSVASEDNGTVKRRPKTDKYSTVSELALSSPVDLFTASRGLEVADLNAGLYSSEVSCLSDKEHTTLSMINTSPAVRNQQIASIEEDRGASLDTHMNVLHSSNAKAGATAEDEMQSFFSDSFIRPHRGLRKKLSNLKSRIIEPRHHRLSFSVNAVVPENSTYKAAKLGTEACPPNVFEDPLTEISRTKDHHNMTPTRTVRSKLGKLVKGMRYRLRTWGKHKHKNESVDTA